MTDGALLRGRELAVWRGNQCVFEQLHFDLGPEQLALLIGPNGSGKTTLLRVLAGLALPTSGGVTWKGVAVHALTPEDRADVAYRGHLEALKRDLTVAENLAFHASLWGREPQFDGLLAELKLDRAAHMRARHLSAGQRRISTAKAARCSSRGRASTLRAGGSPSSRRINPTSSQPAAH
jgi:heme exporter protein A